PTEEPLTEVELVGGTAADWGGGLRIEPLRAEPLRAEPPRMERVRSEPPRMDPPRIDTIPPSHQADWGEGELIRGGGLRKFKPDEIEPDEIEPEEMDLEEIEAREAETAYDAEAAAELPGFPESGGFVEAELPASEPEAPAP